MTKYEKGVHAVVAARQMVSGNGSSVVLERSLNAATKVDDRFSRLRAAIIGVVKDAGLEGLLPTLKLPDPLTAQLTDSSKARRLYSLCDDAETALTLITVARSHPGPQAITPATRNEIWDLQGKLPPEDRKGGNELDGMSEEQAQAWLEACRNRKREVDEERRLRREAEVDRAATAKLQPLLLQLETVQGQLRDKTSALIAAEARLADKTTSLTTALERAASSDEAYGALAARYAELEQKALKTRTQFDEDCAAMGLNSETWAAEVLEMKKTKLQERPAEPEETSTNGEKPVDKPKASLVKVSEAQQLQFELNGNQEVPRSCAQLSSFSSDEIEEYLLQLQEKLKAKLAAAPASQPARSGEGQQTSVNDLPTRKSLEQMNENLRRDKKVVCIVAAVLLAVAIVLGIFLWNAPSVPADGRPPEEPEPQAEETPFVPFKAKPLPSLN